MKRMLFIVLMMTAATATAAELTLERALAAAVANHPSLPAAAAEREAAAARAEQAGALPNPSVFLRLEDAPRDGDAWSGANRIVGLSQTIPWSGRIGAEKRAAEALAERAELEQRIALAELRSRVTVAFGKAVFARDVLALAEESARTAKRLVEIVTAKVETGDAAGLDLHRAEMESAQARIALMAARGSLRTTFETLSSLTGTVVEAVIGELSLPIEDYSFDALMSGLDTSPRLLVAERDAAASSALVSAASRMRLPELELEAGLRTMSDGESFDAAVSFMLPLFDRGGARLSAAQASETAAQARTRSVRRELENTLRTLSIVHGSLMDSAELYEGGLLERSDAVLQATHAAYAAGELSMGDVLQVREDWSERRSARLELLLALAETGARIHAAFGR